MNDTIIKLPQEEMTELNLLRSQISKNIFSFGELSVEKMQIDRLVSEYVEKDKKLREERLNLERVEKEFVNKLIKKYGEGEINLKDGTYHPVVAMLPTNP